jgi:2-polyprenyl-3-methyl-5-hydroxy-6-metoxy-1,4-benzoquinol methylase
MQHWRPLICPFELLLPLVPDGARVLDVGCGCGLWMGLLAHEGRGIAACGVDVDEQRVAIARRAQPGAVTVAAEPSGWPAGPFDTVTLIDVLHHVPVALRGEFVRAAVERLAPGGLLIVKEMAARPRALALMNRLHDLVMAREWITEVDAARLPTSGLEPVTQFQARRLWYMHWARVWRKAPTKGT